MWHRLCAGDEDDRVSGEGRERKSLAQPFSWNMAANTMGKNR